jgi:hypothetical protein
VAGGPSQALTVHQRGIESSRQQIAAALADLEIATRELATPRHWIRAAGGVFRRHPIPVLAGAFALGWWIGHGRGREAPE